MDRLTRSIEAASAAGQWDIVRMLADQLAALTRGPNVVDLASAKKRRT